MTTIFIDYDYDRTTKWVSDLKAELASKIDVVHLEFLSASFGGPVVGALMKIVLREDDDPMSFTLRTGYKVLDHQVLLEHLDRERGNNFKMMQCAKELGLAEND